MPLPCPGVGTVSPFELEIFQRHRDDWLGRRNPHLSPWKQGRLQVYDARVAEDALPDREPEELGKGGRHGIADLALNTL